jgi:hypothetical protein
VNPTFPVSALVTDHFGMTKNSQTANSTQNVRRDEVLRRMLKMKPQPHKSKKFGSCTSSNFADSKENFSDAKDSASDISNGNEIEPKK